MAFQTLLNVIDHPDVASEWPREMRDDGTGNVDVPCTYPRYDEMVVAAKAEANGGATWARWAPGLPEGNDANLQVDVALAAAADWQEVF